MGLAASQCRFLMLTSRESDVEAKLMALSNQQMALTNKATKLSMDYSKALSAQDVFFNDSLVSYKNIMNPNMVQNASGVIPQYIFKTAKGAVILSQAKAITCGLMDEIRGGKTVGTGYDFRKLYPTKEKFLEKVLSGYNASNTASSSATTMSSSGYKYDDKIMNDAVVSVQSASVLNLGGYTFDQLEYAMGTQEELISSYACIWTLDQFQYTDSNVHSIVNTFVTSAVEEMSNVMSSNSNLGQSTAVSYALNYAKQKTLDYYAGQTIDESNKDIMETLKLLDKGNYMVTRPKIKVSNVDYETTEFTGVNQGASEYNITKLTGKDIFVDTAQLTAVFLNYFDAGMLYAMVDGSESGAYNLISSDIKDTDSAAVKKQKQEQLDQQTALLRQTIKSQADAVAALNDADNPLQQRIDKQNLNMEGINGYNKSQVGDSYSNASTGFFGDTKSGQDGSSTSSSTLSAQKDFYGYMYDALKSNGWSYNTGVTDSQFLSDQMQRQNIILCEYSKNKTNGSALSVDDSSSGLSLVDSNARLEAAEAAYEAESAKIDYKTSVIEAQMDTLNTELTSIQAEKESVQAIIDKKLEKFNLFG